jgi:hypothetical protein
VTNGRLARRSLSQSWNLLIVGRLESLDKRFVSVYYFRLFSGLAEYRHGAAVNEADYS